jgi:hypothetical protein
VVRFIGGSGPVIGDVVSVCFRFKEGLDIEFVLVVTVPELVPEACADVEVDPDGCGTVLCCFRGELLVDGEAF